MQVLSRQGDEFDAAGVPRQCIFQGGRLRRPDGGIALLLPDPEQRLEAWCAIGLSRGSEAMVWRFRWRFLPVCRWWKYCRTPSAVAGVIGVASVSLAACPKTGIALANGAGTSTRIVQRVSARRSSLWRIRNRRKSIGTGLVIRYTKTWSVRPTSMPMGNLSGKYRCRVCLTTAECEAREARGARRPGRADA